MAASSINRDNISDTLIEAHQAPFARTQRLSPESPSQMSQELATATRHRAMRQAGARLDNAFVSMASHVIDEAQVQVVFLPVEGYQLEGIRYRGQLYRKVKAFELCHRLQSYCLAQMLSEQQLSYVITRSDHRFAVWVGVQDLPKQLRD